MADFTDIVVSYARLYRAPVGTSMPALGTTTWAAPWVDLGLTASSLTFTHEVGYLDLMVEQYQGPVAQIQNSEVLTIETTLAEFNSTSFTAVIPSSVTAVPVAGGVPAHNVYKGGGDATKTLYAYAIEYTKPLSANVIRMLIYQGQAAFGAAIEIGKEVQTNIPIKISGYPDRSKAKGEQLFIMYEETTAP